MFFSTTHKLVWNHKCVVKVILGGQTGSKRGILIVI